MNDKVVSGRKGQARVLSISAYSQEFHIRVQTSPHCYFTKLVIWSSTFLLKEDIQSCSKLWKTLCWKTLRVMHLTILILHQCSFASIWTLSDSCLNTLYNHNVRIQWQKCIFCVLPSLHILYFRILRVGGIQSI